MLTPVLPSWVVLTGWLALPPPPAPLSDYINTKLLQYLGFLLGERGRGVLVKGDSVISETDKVIKKSHTLLEPSRNIGSLVPNTVALCLAGGGGGGWARDLCSLLVALLSLFFLPTAHPCAPPLTVT